MCDVDVSDCPPACTHAHLRAAQLLLDCIPMPFLGLFLLLFDLFCENVLAFVPVEPPDGTSSRTSARGCDLMLQSLSCSQQPYVSCGIKQLAHYFDICFHCSVFIYFLPQMLLLFSY